MWFTYAADGCCMGNRHGLWYWVEHLIGDIIPDGLSCLRQGGPAEVVVRVSPFKWGWKEASAEPSQCAYLPVPAIGPCWRHWPWRVPPLIPHPALPPWSVSYAAAAAASRGAPVSSSISIVPAQSPPPPRPSSPVKVPVHGAPPHWQSQAARSSRA
jgi:hypothetical protein